MTFTYKSLDIYKFITVLSLYFTYIKISNVYKLNQNKLNGNLQISLKIHKKEKKKPNKWDKLKFLEYIKMQTSGRGSQRKHIQLMWY